ncbi:glycoside hydrolase family 31 protein [Fulvivirgaceae bacterium BMA12]|uniref:Glycoside hydrolase family 31 protein n=1 Tax=Agaribacillus aureus TaxID=3051825 RepID=A0ABT8LB79_9BACT|nr:glycoside hydrolase family 31 protein [Fulvivirgaceae bacterium BMA12]
MRFSRKKILFFILGIGCVIQSYAQDTLGKIQSHEKQKNSVLFKCANGEIVKLSVIADDIIRIQAAADGTLSKSAMIKWGFVKNDFPPANFELSEDNDQYQITTASVTIRIAKQQFGLQVLDKAGNLVLRNNDRLGFQPGSKNVLNFDMPADEHFFGFGFMRKTLDARGHKLTFRRGYRWKEATLPFFMSTRGYAFYSNNVYNHEFDFTAKSTNQSSDFYSITSNGGQMDFYIIYGPDFTRLLDRYTDLTGKSMLVPRWAFGLQYRLRYYGDQQELLGIAREFRAKEIPCDIVALEPGWEEVAYSMKWKWSPERFPEPKKMIRELGEMGFKLDLWESGVAPTKNITDLKTRKNWYAKRKDIVDMGVRMFKQDDPYPRSILSSELLGPVLANNKLRDDNLSAEELNNVANSLYSETLFNEFRKQTKERAVVMFHAYNASVASHRWPFQWAGDFQAENGMLNASLSGHAMVSYDIRNPYAAGWHQGFFTPFSVVDAWAYYREPWLYSESIEQSHRLYACLRSRLVPYLYSSLWQSSKTGLPVERPMVLYYHDDPITHQMKSQFMVGDWFLLALSDVDDSPAGEKIDFWTGLQKGNYGRIYLPKGRWIDYWSGEIKNIEKAQWVKGEWPEYLGGLLYVKAGAIIPMGQVKNYIGETKDEVMVLDIYPHKTSAFQLYEDDGISYNYEKGEFALTPILCEQTDNKVTISISARKGEYNNMPEKRTFLVKMHSLLPPTSIIADGKELAFHENLSALIHDTEQKGWSYDVESKKVIIKLDKGWKYVENDDDKNPLATIPLTAKNELIEWNAANDIKEQDRQIVVQMPQRAVIAFSSNMEALPADGYSRAKVAMQLKNSKQPVESLKLKIDGPGTFLNGKSAMTLKPAQQESFTVIAGTNPGIVKISVTGDQVEAGSFAIPVYGKPVRLQTIKENTVFVADGANKLNFSVKLFDEGAREVLTAGSPVIVTLEGEAICENGLTADSIYFKNGQATFSIQSTRKPGKVKVATSFNGLKGSVIETASEKGEMQVRINPPEKVKLDSDGGWIPDRVDVFVNFKAAGKLGRNIENKVTLNVYNKQNELLDSYRQDAKKGEVIFKDISYYRRPAQCLFEIKSEGYETVTRKVFANTWDEDPNKPEKKRSNH